MNTKSAIVYLVDDEHALRDSLTILLESEGFSVQCFESAENFLKAYKPEQHGCLILDEKMPGMSGLSLQEKLTELNIHIPIIFISGNTDCSGVATAFRGGAVDFLEKPFEHEIFIERIQEALAKDSRDRITDGEREKVLASFNQLTKREKEVLKLTVENNSSKHAAKKLWISHRTVEAHRKRIMEKMGVSNAVALVSKVLAANLYQLPLSR